MAKSRSVLFLTLRVFSATGGIEKVCRVFGKALMDIAGITNGMKVKVFSVYDTQKDVDTKYIPESNFAGFGKAKLKFVISALWQSMKQDTIIVSHINILSVGYIAKFFFPKKRLILFAHGIEVWAQLSGVRKKMLSRCDNILAVSQFTKDRLIEQCNVPDEKIIVLNNCLDPYLPPPLTYGKDENLMQRYRLAKNDIILFTLTRLSSKELYKGYDHVLYSMKQLKAKFPSLKYIIAGRYDAAEKKRLDAIIEQCYLQGQVVFTGYIPDEELAAHFSLADVYIMPSKKEGFGIVFIEAMYYGLPVIAGNKDGSADALVNGKLGMLVDPDNKKEIEMALEKIILNKSLYQPDKILLDEFFSYTAYKQKCAVILDAALT